MQMEVSISDIWAEYAPLRKRNENAHRRFRWENIVFEVKHHFLPVNFISAKDRFFNLRYMCKLMLLFYSVLFTSALSEQQYIRSFSTVPL